MLVNFGIIKLKFGFDKYPDARHLAKHDSALFLQRYSPPVLIDEIQYATELLPVDEKLIL